MNTTAVVQVPYAPRPAAGAWTLWRDFRVVQRTDEEPSYTQRSFCISDMAFGCISTAKGENNKHAGQIHNSAGITVFAGLSRLYWSDIACP